MPPALVKRDKTNIGDPAFALTLSERLSDPIGPCAAPDSDLTAVPPTRTAAKQNRRFLVFSCLFDNLQFCNLDLNSLSGELLFGPRTDNSVPGPAPGDPNLRKKVGIPVAVKNHLGALGRPTFYPVVQRERALVVKLTILRAFSLKRVTV